MSMLDEIEKLMQSVGTSYNYRIVNLGGKSVYIEGIKSVIFLSIDEMQFQLKESSLSIIGKQLSIKYLDKNSAVITGGIITVGVK